MEELMSFYELKLRVTEWFYYSYIEEECSFLQSAEICFDDFTYIRSQNNLSSVNFIFTISHLLLKHDVELDDEYASRIQQALIIYENSEEKHLLNAKEAEDLLEDYKELKKAIGNE